MDAWGMVSYGWEGEREGGGRGEGRGEGGLIYVYESVLVAT